MWFLLGAMILGLVAGCSSSCPRPAIAPAPRLEIPREFRGSLCMKMSQGKPVPSGDSAIAVPGLLGVPSFKCIARGGR